MAWPYSRLTEEMTPESPDDNPANLPQEDGKTTGQWDYPKQVVTDATPDVGATCWGENETFRRLNCRGK